jgi:hypothetical protein
MLYLVNQLSRLATYFPFDRDDGLIISVTLLSSYQRDL